MKRILGIVSGLSLLGFFMFFQLQAMKQGGYQIYVYIAKDAIQSLGLDEEAKKPFLIKLSNNTTARDVIEEIVMPTTALYMPYMSTNDDDEPKSVFHPYGKSLADAYKQKLLSLWAVYGEGEGVKPLTPKIKLNPDDIIMDFLSDDEDSFVIRYNK